MQRSRTSDPAPAVVFDWDGTLRNGWTIEDWLDVVAKVLRDASHHRDAFADGAKRYRAGSMTHDDLVALGQRLYLDTLALMNHVERDEIEAEAALRGRSALRPFSEHLVRQLRFLDVRCFVITGAPQSVVRDTARSVGLRSLDGLIAIEGCAGWRIVQNPGFRDQKRRLVKQLAEEHRIVAAFGDADSDWPLWDEADIPVIVSDEPIVAEGLVQLRGDGTGYEAVQQQLLRVLA
jgi:phosphoserine phosphatase